VIIYRATNFLNGKVYIGQTKRNLEERKKEHLAEAKRGSGKSFHRAIRESGAENFKWEVMCTASSPQQLDLLETFYIYSARKQKIICYNKASGGNSWSNGWK